MDIVAMGYIICFVTGAVGACANLFGRSGLILTTYLLICL